MNNTTNYLLNRKPSFEKKSLQFVVFEQNGDGETIMMGTFSKFQDAVDFRKEFLFESFDLNGEDWIDLSDEDFEHEFELTFGGNIRAWELSYEGNQYIIDEVFSYTRK